jgi:hypothetical protein
MSIPDHNIFTENEREISKSNETGIFKILGYKFLRRQSLKNNREVYQTIIL